MLGIGRLYALRKFIFVSATVGGTSTAPTAQRTINRALKFGALIRNPPNPAGPTDRAVDAENLRSDECPREVKDTEAIAAIEVDDESG